MKADYKMVNKKIYLLGKRKWPIKSRFRVGLANIAVKYKSKLKTKEK